MPTIILRTDPIIAPTGKLLWGRVLMPDGTTIAAEGNVAESPAGSGVYPVRFSFTGADVSNPDTPYSAEVREGTDATTFNANTDKIRGPRIFFWAVGGIAVSEPIFCNLDAKVSAAGGGDVLLTPLLVQANNPRFTTRDIAPIIVGSAPADLFIAVDVTEAPIDLTGKTVRAVVFKYDDKEPDNPFDDVFTGVFKYETGGSGITIGTGTNSNQVTLQHSTNNTAMPLDGKYILWNVTDRVPIARGKLPIVPGVFDV